jgi:hypothetical protein
MMNLTRDFERLQRRANGFNRWAAVAIAGGFGLLLLAFAVGPGGYGAAGRFYDIQLHLALADYFGQLGVVAETDRNRIAFGMRLSQIHAALDAAVLLLGLTMLGALVRLKWRGALGCLAGIAVISMVSGAQDAHDGYRTAAPQEFGVWLRPPGRLPADANVVGRAAETYAWVDAKAWSDYNRRIAQGARFAADVSAGGAPGMTAQQRAALRYTEAELAYSRRAPAEVAGLLNAIPQADFPTTYDSDWRMRVLREYAQANGFALAPGAYRAVTGWPFGWLRALSLALAVCGLAALALALAMTECSRTIRRRLKRMHGMAGRMGQPIFGAG